MYLHKHAFLLMELMLSLTIMSFSIILFGQFFSYLCGTHYNVRNRLDTMLTVQNMLEMIWYNQRNAQQNENYLITTIQLPLPTHIGDIPIIDTSLHYTMIKVCNKQNKITVALPGYIYATS